MTRPQTTRKPHGVSASSVGRALECAWWARDEHVWVPVGDEDPLAARGTAGHAAVEALLRGQQPAPGLDDEVLEQAHRAAEWVRAEGLQVRGVEQVLFYDARRGLARVAAGRGHRAYAWESWAEIPGTADLLAADRDLVPVVADWKFMQPGQRRVWSVEHHVAQLRTLALAWSLVVHGPSALDEGRGRARAVVVKLTRRAALPHWVDVCPPVLRAHAVRLYSTMRDLRRSEQHAGEHCRYCVASGLNPVTGRPNCEAWGRMAERDAQLQADGIFE